MTARDAEAGTPLPTNVAGAAPSPPIAEARAIALALVEGFDKHYALFRECARAARRHFEAGNWLAIQHVGARPHRLLRPPRARDRRAHRARLPRRGPRRRDALWEEVKLHYIGLLDRSQAARMRRDVLQLGARARSCTGPTSTTASSSCGPRSPPSTSTPNPPSYRSYYPLQTRPAHRADRHRPRLPASSVASPTSAAISRNVLRGASASGSPRPFRLEANHQIQVLSSPFYPQPDRVHRRPRRQRHPHVSVRRRRQARRGRQALRRRAADGRSRARASCSRRTARTSWSTWRCRRPTSTSCARCSPTRPRPSSTRWSGCRRPARTSSTAISCTTSSTRATSFIIAPGHQGPRDDGVHAAVLSVRVQGDPRPDRARRKDTDRAEGQAEVRAGQAPRPRRPHDRHPRVLGRRVSARALLRRADRRADGTSRRR